MDEETECWPVPPPLRGELNGIKFEYHVVPLPIYVNENFIEPVNVNSAIKGILVELHFELHHFAFQKAGQDSFNATIKQIIVLHPGEACHMTAYKRKNLMNSIGVTVGILQCNPIQFEKSGQSDFMK